MRAERVLRVAGLEMGELARDPNVGVLLGVLVLLANVNLLSAFGSGVLGLAFLAGSRRSAAHESAFRRLVLTCPVTPMEWLVGRFAGLHALGLVYLALVALPVLASVVAGELTVRALLGGIASYAGLASLLFLAGLALFGRGNPRAPVALVVVVVLVFFTSGSPILVHQASEGASEVVARVLVAALPHVQWATLAGRASLSAPTWSAGLAAASSLVLLGVVAAARCDLPAARRARWWSGAAWVATALVLAVTLEAGAAPSSLLPPLGSAWLVLGPALAIVPLSFAVARRARRLWTS